MHLCQFRSPRFQPILWRPNSAETFCTEQEQIGQIVFPIIQSTVNANVIVVRWEPMMKPYPFLLLSVACSLFLSILRYIAEWHLQHRFQTLKIDMCIWAARILRFKTIYHMYGESRSGMHTGCML